MKGVTFGTLHSYRDLNLILQPGKEIGSPEVKKKELDIEGADSSLDYTDFFGGPKYSNLTHKFPFAMIVPTAGFPSRFSEIKNALHGKKVRIILDDDPAFYYVGRVNVRPGTIDKGIGKVTIECDCEPYKYKLNETVVSKAVNGTDIIVLANGRKHAVPEVVIANSATTMRIEYQGVNIWDLANGSYTLPELELVEGNNTVTVTGTGNVTFKWQEGDL